MPHTLKVAIQGGPASFHEAAAQQHFQKFTFETLACESFECLCEALHCGEVQHAVMAIENKLVGMLHDNQRLLQQYNFTVQADLWLPIDQNIMALPGQQLQDIHTVLSHPVALQQCGQFLERYPHLRTQVTHDTADSARAIRTEHMPGTAAIASRKAAELYGLEILKENIADQKDNFTRFLVLSRQQDKIKTQQ